MGETALGRRRIGSVISLLEGELGSDINTNKSKSTKHPQTVS